MNKHQMLIKIIFVLFPLFCYSQNENGLIISKSHLPATSGEQITLHTDRTLYCVNENIYFTANYTRIDQMQPFNWSKVLYTELIRWNGDKIAQAKFAILSNNVSGKIAIPKDLPSGVYYVRAYTRWMRNFPEEGYVYTRVKIVNLFKTDTDIGPDNNQNFTHLVDNTSKINMKKGIVCSSPKNKYKKREKITLDIDVLNKSSEIGDLFITVVREGSIDTISNQIIYKFSGINGSDIYLPEIRGISITGKVLDKNTRNPLSNTLVNLTIPVSNEYFSNYRTNEKGTFYFTIPPIYGKTDFYIEAITSENIETEILIDNDFCQNPVILPFIQFSLNSKEEELVKEFAVNVQLNELFSENYKQQNVKTVPEPFYGSASNVYLTKDYIELPNLKEFFFELISEFSVLHNKKIPYLKLRSPKEVSYIDPLILVDNVPIVNQEKLLKTPLKEFERIDIIDKPYIVRDIVYNGLISVYSKNSDFAGIELHSNSMFFNFNLFSQYNFVFPEKNSTENNRRLPERRNLLYWNPNVRVTENSPINISLYSSDDKGEYIVFIRSINNKNDLLTFGTYKFTVE